MMFSFPAFDKRGPGLWWRSSLIFSCIIIGFLLYLESEYRYVSNGKITEIVPASPSSVPLKLNEQIKALEKKVNILQKRYGI